MTTLTQKFFLFPCLYKGNYKRILVGYFAKVPSLNSHENGVLAGCFFKNSKYVYKHPSTYIKGAFCRKVRGQSQIFKVYLQSSLSFLIVLGESKLKARFEKSLSLYLCKSRFLRKSSRSKAKIQNMFTTSPLT